MARYIPKHVRAILEPSAGQGAIVQAINAELPKSEVFYCELMELNRMQFAGDAKFIQEDFLTLDESVKFDAVVANPPFSKNQDIDHFYKMCSHAEEIVISVMSNHWRFCNNKKEVAFREFLMLTKATILDLPAGTFKESGTNIATCLVILEK